ncbi:MAG: N-formylglutamate amidohydrolase [Alphaproteobacteria bacterium]|nr:N-formylglutamate amidohydrolase [Alphaproteobacteria bacterium]
MNRRSREIVTKTVLAPQDPVPVEFHSADGARVILCCDHASNRVPRTLVQLGLGDEVLARHIGWDIGAAAVTRRLAPALGAASVLAGYSRLVIDCNRDPDDPSSIPATSDGVVVPGNRELSADARHARRAAIFTPYHTALTQSIDAVLARGAAPALISVHSFTPSLGGKARPWHIGILWDGDGRIASPLLAALRDDAALVVGDNEPYSARQPAGYTMRHHALERGLPHVAIEIRQDEIADDAGAAAWANRLAAALRPILDDGALYRLWQK